VSLVIPNLSFYAVPVMLAQHKGYFADEGYELDVTTTGSGAKATAALLGGSADLGVMEFTDLLGAVEKRQPVQVFAAMVTEPNVSIALKKSLAEASGLTDQSSVADKIKALKGKKVAITSPGSGTDSSLRWALLYVGLDPDRDVEIVPSGSAANELAAFAQGQVDAFAQTSPWIEQSIAKHGAFMVVSFPRGDVPEQRGRLAFALATVKSTMDNKPEVLTGATRAVWRSLKLIKDQPDEAKTVTKQALFADVDADVYDAAWKMNAASFPSDPRLTPQHVQLTLDFRKRITGEQSILTFEQLATNQFVDAVAASIR
jgi:NitT/TauT family transport system substrate-binding protein